MQRSAVIRKQGRTPVDVTRLTQIKLIRQTSRDKKRLGRRRRDEERCSRCYAVGLWLWVGFNADCRIAGLKTWPGPFTIDSLGAFFVFFGLSLFHFHFYFYFYFWTRLLPFLQSNEAVTQTYSSLT